MTETVGMTRYLVQVVGTSGQWISIAGSITRHPVTDAFLGGAGVARFERYRVFDRVGNTAIAEGVR